MRSLTLMLSLLLSSFWIGWVAAQEAPIRFAFAPQDAERWVEEMVDRRMTDMGLGDPAQLQETNQRDELIYARSEDGGYVLTRVLGPAEMSLGGEPVSNAILEASEGTRIELQLDEQGVAVGVKGYRRLMRLLERKLDSDEWTRFQDAYSVARAEAAEMARWNDRLAGLVGAEFRAGDVWGYTDVYPASGVEVLIRGTMRFDGSTELNGQRGFKILYEFGGGSHAPSLDGLQTVLDLRHKEPGHAPPENYELKGKRVRVFVPESGQLIYENTEVEWVQPGPPGQPDRSTQLQTIYRLRPASEPD